MDRPEFLEHMRMMGQLSSEALNSEEVNTTLMAFRFYTWIQSFTALFRSAQSNGDIDPDLDPSAVVGLIIAL